MGLPLAVALAEGGRPVTCIDVSADAVRRILAGDSYISDVPSEKLAQLVGAEASTPPAAQPLVQLEPADLLERVDDRVRVRTDAERAAGAPSRCAGPLMKPADPHGAAHLRWVLCRCGGDSRRLLAEASPAPPEPQLRLPFLPPF